MPAISRIVAAAIAASAGLAAAGTALATGSARDVGASTTATPTPPQRLIARRMHPRRGALPRGMRETPSNLFTARVFPTDRVGFALADDRSAQYPTLSTDGGESWRIDGPQLHVDAADGPEAVGFVGTAGAHTFFAYGSSAIDVTTDGGRSWWETFAGELVMAVVPGMRGGELVAYVQQSASDRPASVAATWQYVSRDGGRTWRYSTALGG